MPRASAAHRLRPALWRAGSLPILGVIAAGALGVALLWLTNAPPVSGAGDALTAAGDILGLLAGYGVVVLVALMARLPPLERGIGASQLSRWHALGGRYVMSVIAAHAVLITWGYALSAHVSLVSETASVLTTQPDVLMATAGAVLLLAVGIASARAIRRSMSYETWYYLHLYAYLGIALAFSHQFAVGGTFAGSLADRVAWSLLYGAVAGLVHLVPDRHPGAPAGPAPLPRRRAAPGGAGDHVPCTSPESTSRSCAPRPASSSAGGSCPASTGGSRTPTRCPPCPSRTCCGSP